MCRLTSIVIPDSVTSIGNGAFCGCPDLTYISVEKGNNVYHSSGNCLIETKSKTLILGCKNSIIPDDNSVECIEEIAFLNSFGLTSIEIPDSVTNIGRGLDFVFVNCFRLVQITNLSGQKLENGEGLPDNIGQEMRSSKDTPFVNSLFTDEDGLTIFTVGDKKYAFSYTGTDTTLDLSNKGITDISLGFFFFFC